MVAVLNESVPQRILGDGGQGLALLVFPQQEVDHLLLQRLRCHLPYDPVEQGRRGQDAHLGPVRPKPSEKTQGVSERSRHEACPTTAAS